MDVCRVPRRVCVCRVPRRVPKVLVACCVAPYTCVVYHVLFVRLSVVPRLVCAFVCCTCVLARLCCTCDFALDVAVT